MSKLTFFYLKVSLYKTKSCIKVLPLRLGLD